MDRNTVKAWYREIGLGLRQIRKDLAGGRSPDREEQFERIGKLTDQYLFKYYLQELSHSIGRYTRPPIQFTLWAILSDPWPRSRFSLRRNWPR